MTILKRVLLGFLVLAGLFMTGCGPDTIRGKEYPINDEKTVADDADLSIDERVQKIVDAMSDEEKVGQMMMIGIQGTTVTDDTRYMLNQYKAGNIILFDRNMQSQEQVKELTTDLQKENSAKVPLFIAVDEEGGDVVRMKNDLQAPPSQQAVGSSGNPATAKDYAFSVGMQLKGMGINMNFAPVADVSATDSRSYGGNASQVYKFVDAAAYGYEAAHIMYGLKHFPGIGRSAVDSHEASSVITTSKSELFQSDLIPFTKTMASHDTTKFVILVSHLVYTGFDAEHPASLSWPIMTDLLRNGLQYKGLIVTDDMEMGAVTGQHSFRDLGVMAINAGADIVLICHEYGHEKEVYDGILAALKDGRIPRSRVEDSVKRIVKIKLLHLNEEINN